VSVTLCNLNPEKTENIEIALSGMNFTTSSGQIVTGQSMNDYNDFGQEEKVTLQNFEVKNPKNGQLKLELPAKSVVLVQLQ
jgi:alpha-N-arabinofuranosidase